MPDTTSCAHCHRPEVPVFRRGVCRSCHRRLSTAGLPLPAKGRGGRRPAPESTRRGAVDLVAWARTLDPATRDEIRAALNACNDPEAARDAA